jgi:adenine-specific DNA-methyltransferase
MLDPGCGSGSLLMAAAHEKLRTTKLLGIDVDPLAVDMSKANARLRGVQNIEVRLGDFLRNELPEAPEAVICNPPYTRHHELSSVQKRAIFRGFRERLGIEFHQTASLHVLFLVRALEISAPDARLAFITPAHWMDKRYAVAVKEFLLKQAHVESIVSIPASEIVFDHAITNAAITLIQKGEKRRKLTRVLESASSRGPDVQAVLDRPRSGMRTRLSTDAKWSRVSRNTQRGPRLGDVAEVHRGVATGCNEFFVLSERYRRELGIAPCSVRPCLPGPKQIEDDVITKARLDALDESVRRWLFYPQKVRSYGPIADYLSYGLEEYDMLDRTLVQQRVRAGRPWYRVEARVDAPIVARYINQGKARFLRNRANALPLNNWLAIKPRRGIRADDLFAILTQPRFAGYLRSQAREYGQGMWKLEPSELANVRLPRGSIRVPNS